MRGAVTRLMVTSLVVLVSLTGAGLYVIARMGEREAVRDARESAELVARGIIGPVLTDAALAGESPDAERLDAVVRERVLDDVVVRVKVWSAAGTVLYSDESRLVGATYALDEDDIDSLRTGKSAAGVSDLDRPENRFERGAGDLLEVYLPVATTPGGREVLLETYERFEDTTADARRLWVAFAPPLVGGLLLLWLVQAPLAASMARRIDQGRRERERLLARAVEASSVERRRVAADLHDGVVQQLAGTAYSVSAAARRLGAAPPAEVAAELDGAAAGLRRAIRELRSLIVQIHPPNLRSEGLPAALADLAGTLRASGLDVTVDTAGAPALDAGAEELVFRGAQEAVRNVAAHAGATRVVITVAADGGRAVLTVADDGRGFTPAAPRRDGGDHLGLDLLAELAADMGGEVTVASQPGAGTVLRLEVPAA